MSNERMRPPFECAMEAVAVSERISSVQDGVTNRTEVSYSFDENVYWRVTTRSVVGPSTNSVTATRAQLTGLSDALRSRTISVSADGVATTNVVSYDSETMVETSVTSSPAFGTRVARGVCGLVLEEETADETIAHIYDPHGREERTDRRAHGEADFRTVAEFVYSPMGDFLLLASFLLLQTLIVKASPAVFAIVLLTHALCWVGANCYQNAFGEIGFPMKKE